MNVLHGLPDDVEAPLRSFFAYWDSLPKTHLLPTLADFFDRVPPDLVPYVAIVDVRGPAETHIRFFGTQLVERVEFDPTGLAIAGLYAERLRAAVHGMLWRAVTQPAGYFARRRIVTGRGLVNEHPSMALPIAIPTSGVRGVASFSRAVTESKGLQAETEHIVQEMKMDRWLDIGAGVPE